MIKIDGSQGEGGGQIVRSALSLAMLTGKSFEMGNIRVGRKKPGLMRQHFMAVSAAAQVCGADLAWASLGSTKMGFYPGKVASGNYEFRVGTAGSTTLLFQTILPALMVADGPSNLVIEGGTHNPHAPPYDFLARAFLPLVNKLGPQVTTTLDRYGFYPAGGGQFRAQITPVRHFQELNLMARGKLLDHRARIILANLPSHIGERECKTLRTLSGWPDSAIIVESPSNCRNSGNAVLMELEFEAVTEVCTAFGEIGIKAERVAHVAWDEAKKYLESGAPVGEHLADQLMLPLAVSAYAGGPGGTYRSTALSCHSTTHLDVLRKFLDMEVTVDRNETGEYTVSILPQ
jgi:RNA 3'-terminal phosphate cyclase (ATP)